ncbi:hypothetical protein LH51_01035 [Nitrincola sp. A-D6]|uniref:hypothetical protein n=1 Tax=Nitrincola sp. A-D6 TaxID=1545442 RepID=UPI00051FE415|nr:hypothetical protein [Nitrincola sp. A-D6]KGK43254.1 hypothetical protein LH51_01035 [Nitrincola sp. A-D6]
MTTTDYKSLELCKERLKAIASIATLRSKEIYRRILKILEEYKLDVGDYDLVVLPVGYIYSRPRYAFAAELLPTSTTGKSSANYKCIEQVSKNHRIYYEEHEELTVDLRCSFCFIDEAIKQKARNLGNPVFVGYQPLNPIDVVEKDSQVINTKKLNLPPTFQ